MQNDVRTEALETHKNYISIANLNTQCMSSMSDECLIMLCQHPVDIITLSETWLQNYQNLLQYIQIPEKRLQ